MEEFLCMATASRTSATNPFQGPVRKWILYILQEAAGNIALQASVHNMQDTYTSQEIQNPDSLDRYW